MKHIVTVALLHLVVFLIAITPTPAQPRFEVPLTITDGAATQTLYFGILPGAHYCIDPIDTINNHAEGFLPPVPSQGIFDSRFIQPRPQPGPFVCFDLGSLRDFRPFTSGAQKDTFKINIQLGTGVVPILCWPSDLSTYFTEIRMDSIDMLTHTCVAFAPNYGFGTFRIYSGGLVTSVVQTSPREPERFVLNQNYPNPFNPRTRIEFRIQQSGFVSLKVYDVLGRQVAVLVEGIQEPGEHSVEWNSDGLSSGVYIYRLTTASATATKKMLLLR